MPARRRGRGVPERGMAGVCQQGEGGGGVDVMFWVTRFHLDNFLKWAEFHCKSSVATVDR